MLRATSVLRRAAVKADRVADTLTLDHEARHRRRIALTAEGGLEFLLDLDRATVLDDGDAVKLDDGRLVRIAAAPERLIEVTTDNPLRLMKVAWHIGNRHVAAEIGEAALYIGYDHVLLEMIRGLGATGREVTRPFRPERGAYEGGHDHGHDHHGHDHGHHAHAHDAACGCGPDHHDAHGAHDHREQHAQSHAEAHAHAHSHGDAQEPVQEHSHTHSQSRSHSHEPSLSREHSHGHRHG